MISTENNDWWQQEYTVSIYYLNFWSPLNHLKGIIYHCLKLLSEVAIVYKSENHRPLHVITFGVYSAGLCKSVPQKRRLAV